jgi:molybdopterin-binding protein
VRRRFREDLRRVVEHLAATVIIITHEHAEALALAQRVAVINDGEVVQIGTRQDVFTHPANAFVADFTGAETIWHGKVASYEDGLLVMRTQAGVLVQAVAEADVGATVTIAIRPEDVGLALDALPDAPSRASSVRNRWSGTVDSVTASGPLVRVVVKLDCDPGAQICYGGEGEVISLITRTSTDEMQLEAGVRVVASAKATALNVLAG